MIDGSLSNYSHINEDGKYDLEEPKEIVHLISGFSAELPKELGSIHSIIIILSCVRVQIHYVKDQDRVES